MKATLTPQEIELARHCLHFALQSGAQAARITLNKSLMDLVGIRDGLLDKTAHSLDRSIGMALFVDGRFGTYSINRLERATLETFILDAIATTRMLVADPARRLPAPDRLVKTARTGREMQLYDPAQEQLSGEQRLALALQASLHSKKTALEEAHHCRIVSEEGEYSDSVYDLYVLDSQGLECRHTETCFEIGFEITIEDEGGDKYSSYWWDARPRLQDLALSGCAEKAFERAVAQIGPRAIESQRTQLVVESECASKLVNPLLAALSGYSLQQHNSFLSDTLGKAVFGPNVTLTDEPIAPGENGAKLFDSEGVALEKADIIRDGVVSRYFINSYNAEKMQLSPTAEDAMRPCLAPCGNCQSLEDLLERVGDGILVTGFNGGNNNSSTGDFSYGVDGFLFRQGKIVHPVREIVITGNFITLWQNLIATAQDARPSLSRKIPSLAFQHVEFR